MHFDRVGCALFCSIYTNYSYGKYPENPVKDIWFSRTHAEFMKKTNTGGSLGVCNEICGQTARYFVGNPRQLARNLLLRITRSPLKSGSPRLFQYDTPNFEIKSRSEVIKKISTHGQST
jgi:hypothetical protein